MPKVFISHSSSDKRFALRLALDLKVRGIDVWIDTWEIRVGDSLTNKIQDGIHSSSFLLAVLSPESTKSPWVRVELQAALSREIERQTVFVLPVLLKDCEMPLFLKDKVYADFRGNYSDGLQTLMFAIGSSASHFTDGKELLQLVTNSVIIDKIDEMSPSDLQILVEEIEQKFLKAPSATNVDSVGDIDSFNRMLRQEREAGRFPALLRKSSK